MQTTTRVALHHLYAIGSRMTLNPQGKCRRVIWRKGSIEAVLKRKEEMGETLGRRLALVEGPEGVLNVKLVDFLNFFGRNHLVLALFY
jgi:hypothetical protein